MRKLVIAALIVLASLIVLLLTGDMIHYGNWEVFSHIVEVGYQETQSQNLVTAIYLNYRYYDTLFEALLLIISVIAVIYLSVHKEHYHE